MRKYLLVCKTCNIRIVCPEPINLMIKRYLLRGTLARTDSVHRKCMVVAERLYNYA
jgi:hypothetical protein